MHSKPFFLRSVIVSLFLFSFFQMMTGLAPVPMAHAAASTGLSDIDMFEGIGRASVKSDPREIIRNIINVLMGFLGMLAVLVILYGGFRWMTAGGKKESTEAATKLLTNGVIGLVIIFSAWTLAQFLIYVLKKSVEG